MLYELLTGVLPFDAQALRSAALEEILRQIREVDPPRPSVRVERSAESSTSAAMRQTDPARLVSHLKGDLDWITMKAIEKDRTRRYGSPSELAADVERHLADQPVLAGPPSAVYRARKFVKRHRFGVSAASLGVSALIAFGVTMAIQARRIAAERDRAERVSEFLQDIFAFANPLEAQGKTVTAREILDKGAAKIEKELEGQPLVQAQLMVTMGGAYRLLGQCTDAARLLQSAVDTRVEALGPSDPLTLEAASDLGIALWCAGKLPEAETRLREVVDRSKKTLGPDHATTLHTVSGLAGVLRELGRTDQAEGLYRDALERSRRTLGPNDTLTLGIMSDLAIVVSQKNPGEAVTIMRDLLPRLRGTVGEDHPLYVVALANFASDLRSAGDIPGATAAAEDAFPRARRVMGDTSQVTANAMGGLATLYFEQGRYEDAEKLGDSWLDNRRRSGSVEDLQSIGTKELIARVYSRRHRYAESERLRLETLAVKRGLLSDANDPGISSSLYNLACITALEGKRAEALDWLRQSVAHGFTSVDAIAQDTDLTSLHGDPAFHAVLDEARRKGPPPAGK
jgi:non-specific serine/threonine protein kinase/serine/threonine-protein kinase